MSRAPSPRACAALRAACLSVLVHAAPAAAQDGPTRDDVNDYFSSVRADLFTCGRSWHGSLGVSITFESSGSVTDVRITGEDAPEHVTSCVASVVRGARITAFTAPSAIVDHAIRL